MYADFVKLTQRIRLLGLVVAEVLLVAGLHALGRLDGFSIEWSNLSTWLEETPFEDAVGAVLLLGALVLGYWLLVSTVSYAGASRTGNSPAIRAIGLLTLPPIRRLVSRAVALSVAASAVAGPLAPAIAKFTGANEELQVIVEVDAEGRLRPPGTGSEAVANDESGTILPPHLTVETEVDAFEPQTPVAEPIQPLDGSISHQVTVRRGDHLWSLSESHLQRVLNRSDLGEHEIARYWVTVIDANRPTIRSGEPDLIYPGETIVLPPVHAFGNSED